MHFKIINLRCNIKIKYFKNIIHQMYFIFIHFIFMMPSEKIQYLFQYEKPFYIKSQVKGILA